MLMQKISLRNQTIPTVSLFVALAAVLFGSAFTLVLFNLINSHSVGQASFEETTGYSTYQNPEYNYQISYPSSWQVIEKSNGVLTIASSANPQAGAQAVNLSLSKIDVISYDLDSNLSARQFMLSQSSAAAEGEVSPLMVNGYSAVKMETHLAQALDNHTDNMIYTSVFVTAGNHGYIIAGFAPVSQFNHILNSFHV